MRVTKQRLAGLNHKARQQRFAMEADIKPDTKTRKRTEDAAADRVKHGEKSSSGRVDHNPTCLTSFSDDSTEPPALPCRNDALVDKVTEAPKPCLSPVEMRAPTVTGGLLPSGPASTEMKTIFPPPRLWNFCPTEEINFRTATSIQTYATYNSFWQLKVLET